MSNAIDTSGGVPTDSTYRRRIELRPTEGVVAAAMEDYIHHFALRLHHDDGVVTEVEVGTERTPWTTCPAGAAGLGRLEGVALAEVAALEQWMGSRGAQCVHTVDLAVLAAAAALRGNDRTYEVWMTGIGHPRRQATLLRDGQAWATWVIVDEQVVDEGRFAGLTLDRAGFSAWIAAHLDADDAEAAFVVRRASSIGLGRGLDMDAWATADQARPANESCHTYQAEVVHVARRHVGTARATEGDGAGVAIPQLRRAFVRPARP